MFKKLLLIVLVVGIAIFAQYKFNSTGDPVIIHTTSGHIHGLKHDGYYSFESIPYAKPPIKELRFESPQTYYSPDSVVDGTKSSPMCIQWDHMIADENRLNGQEDCLYINVFVPELKTDKTYPIVVLIHGGAFMFGHSTFIQEKIIMKERNMIMISLHYRLGPIGFMSTEDNIISGNMGLKDQKMALEWIRRNAHAFNGNANEILLTGFSAGGASTHFQILHKDTKVKAAISFSGTANCPWVIVPKPLERTKKLAKLVNCPTDTTQAIKKCLKTKTAADIVSTIKHFQPILYFPFRVFGPVVEANTVKDAFLTKHPNDVIRSGKIPKIPYLVTHTKDEGGYNAAELMMKKDNDRVYLEDFLENFDKLAPIALFYEETKKEEEQIKYTNYLKEKYQLFNNDSLMDKYLRLQEIFSQELFIKDARETVKLHRDFAEAPVYYYLYENSAPFGAGQLLAHRTDLEFGTVHGDDVFLIYNFPARDEYKFRPDEEAYSKKFINMMRNFAITGNLVFGNQEVPPNDANSDKLTYLKITKEKASIVIEDY